MYNLVIGTAGHIDHGKSALVKALTGTDPDRLKEEKARGITIDLGFANLALPSGKTVGLVDVPGHEKFIKNMLAGAAGIDLALLVVAGDEGVMPQTREHLDILKLLEIPELIVVISKADLVEPEILELAEEDVKALLLDTPYRDAPVVFVSALSGQGIKELIDLLDEKVLKVIPQRIKSRAARLPVDRVFTIQGIGTVVTGTLFDGEIKTGDILEEPVSGKRARVRGLQVFNRNVNAAVAGQRAAVNLAGAEAGELKRGNVLITPGSIDPSRRIDVHCRLLKSAPRGLRAMTRVRFHQGTGETLGRVFLLDRAELPPGEAAFIQVVLEEPVAGLRGDNFIIRSYSPVRTIGGGRIVEPLAQKHRAREKGTLQKLEIKAAGQLDEMVILYLENKKGLATIEEIACYLEIDRDTAAKIMLELVKAGKAEGISDGGEKAYAGRETVLHWEGLIAREIKKHLEEFPLEPGAGKEMVRAKLFPAFTVRDFNLLLRHWEQQKKVMLADNKHLAPYGHEVRVEAAWAEKIGGIEERYSRSGWNIPRWDKVRQELGIEEKTAGQILRFLERTNQLICLAEDLYVWSNLLDEAKQKLAAEYAAGREFTVAQVRDLLETNRKVAVPLLEYFDKIKFTQRVGETRKVNG